VSNTDYSPLVPVGLLTKLGVAGAIISSAVAGVTAVLHGDHTPETITSILVAGALVYSVIRARGDQAAAALGNPALPSVGNVVIPPDGDESINPPDLRG
jgi:hypothetical protein